MLVRSPAYVPAQWWIVRVKPLLLPRRLKELREAKGWKQREVEAGLRKLGSPIGKQNSVSRYETGDRLPDPSIVDDLNTRYELPEGELRNLWWIDSATRREMEEAPLPGNSVAVPDNGMPVKRVLAYTRQSVTKEGGKDSLSLDSQVAQLTARCEREGWRIIGVIRESGLKGWMDADERPGLADAVARAERHEYDVLLVWDLSRLARSVRLQEHWFWQFARLGVAILSQTEPESGDALIRQLKGAINEYRTAEISAHIKRAVHELQSRGIHHGVVPWGYVRPERGQPGAIDAVELAADLAVLRHGTSNV
jgi:DNA invertase Pin-like site-specific DNA recombinase/transcriptional regulator with XRE-family HTH domain